MITVGPLENCATALNGTCNACNDQITAKGQTPDATVYPVTFQRTNQSSSGFRVCPTCARDLYDKLGERLSLM